MLTWDESVQKAAEQYADTMLLLEVEREHVIQDFIEGVKWCKNQYTHKEDVELSPREMEMMLNSIILQPPFSLPWLQFS